eukprot:TRINITY_DN20960_c0_g1_i2.p1 TRINITY_DN20960_c0_g1~~TRINITY_DN20960_c0_g1_i2.p1  ORF type:complete len:401 (+),score=118.60 TRINITY_DN20960_c0_g1_i2:59-1261(+)
MASPPSTAAQRTPVFLPADDDGDSGRRADCLSDDAACGDARRASMMLKEKAERFASLRERREQEHARHAKVCRRLSVRMRDSEVEEARARPGAALEAAQANLRAVEADLQREQELHQRTMRSIEEAIQAADQGLAVKPPAMKRRPTLSAVTPDVSSPGSVVASPPRYRQGDQTHQNYSAFLSETFIPGTSRRRLSKVLAESRSKPKCRVSKRLYAEPVYGSSEERGSALREQAQSLREDLRPKDAKKHRPESTERMMTLFHAARKKRQEVLDELAKPYRRDEAPRLTKQAEEELQTRLHDLWLRKRRREEREMEAALRPSSPVTTKLSAKAQAFSDRNFYEQMQHQKEAAEKLRARYPSPIPKPAVLGPQKIKESTQRMCDEEQSRRRDNHKALLKRYLH